MKDKYRLTMSGWKVALGCTALTQLFAPAELFAKPTAVQERPLPDANMTLAIERALRLDSAIDSHRIDVQTTDGIVKLDGRVPTLRHKHMAEAVVGRIKGVRKTVNMLDVRPPRQNDNAILKDVQQMLAEDPVLQGLQVAAKVEGGMAQLNGQVRSSAHKQLVEHLLLGVPSLKGIQNNLQIKNDEHIQDTELEKQILLRLQADARLDFQTINLTVRDSRAIIGGTVRSVAEHQRVMSRVNIPGVTELDTTGLQVRWNLPEDANAGPMKPLTDAEVESAVQINLSSMPRLEPFAVRSLAHQGVVTLMGTVDNLLAKRAATKATLNTRGVLRVHNHIKVRPSHEMTDEQILGRIERALASDAHMRKLSMSIEVRDGVVHVSGIARLPHQIHLAEALIATVPAIIAIDNALTMANRPHHLSDWELFEDIQGQFFWMPSIDATQVRISVLDAVVTISGNVPSWHERRLAETLAKQAGARHVRNHIELRRWSGEPIKSSQR